ncbi:hypothetical protein AN218_29515, partial [Streptomyces nanshensis]
MGRGRHGLRAPGVPPTGRSALPEQGIRTVEGVRDTGQRGLVPGHRRVRRSLRGAPAPRHR